ncbi:unnamed protein product [Cuscuta epithymum]|uniref:Uncharacterized protein n=2 Tax=Cuscuta epithymum TaxID=186058 RepID=A0AAV0C5Q9_9ASTE|nr:unnamed protein product [Cuscuta epithymum]
MISSFATPSSSSSTTSPASSVVVRVEKATSELLIGPDWTLNIDICDTINSNHWLAKDVVKTLKKRLQHKNPTVQLLSLTLLETMVKNCGDIVHFQIAERNIPQDMVKTVKKKTDMHVRDKILGLLDSWQEAFGGPGGKYTQYYWAYDELRRSGVQFPQRTYDAAPILTPPRQHQPGYGMPSNSSTRLDEAMAAEMESLSLSTISSMGDVVHLLADMLQAVNPGDRTGVKNEVIVDLVDRCRASQKKLMQMLTTTGDEKLLAQGLELNDSLQSVLAKHDAIASGATAFPSSVSATINHQPSSPEPATPKVAENAAAAPDTKQPSYDLVAQPPIPILGEEEEEDDDFAQLARRHCSKTAQVQMNGTAVFSDSADMSSSALVLCDPPEPVRTKKEEEQDIINELLGSLTLATTASSPPRAAHTQQDHVHHTPLSPIGNQEADSGAAAFNNYVAPWAKPPPPHQSQPDPHHQYSHYSASAYPPPPWASTPGYLSSNRSTYTPHSTPPPVSANIGNPVQADGGINANDAGGARISSTPQPAANAQKTFVPSYRLFEDLNVFGDENQKLKMTNNPSACMSGKHT